jgi:2-polyprenyl-3-methyl-5-hydroxy-6-metoxy-1,4-benzoquinol methylase
MVGCGDCGSLYLDPRPDARSLPRAYAQYYTHRLPVENVPPGASAGLLWSLVHGYLDWRFGLRRRPALASGAWLFRMLEPLRLKLDYYGRHLDRMAFPTPGRLLDLGCGSGAFLARARDMGWQVTGCDPDPAAVAACRSQGLAVIEGDAFASALDAGGFDVVTLSHAIEHVGDPAAVVRRVGALLAPGGCVWLALPNPASLGLRVFGTAWRGLHLPFHLCIPSQSQLAGMLRAAGFSGIRFLRRGAHAQSEFAAACAIGRREQLPLPPTALVGLLGLGSDLLASCTPRWGEETVVIAFKTGQPGEQRRGRGPG